MDKLERYLLKQRNLNIALYSGVVFLIGVILYYFGIIKANDTSSVVSFNILKDSGGILIGAAAVTVLFGWATKAESVTILSSLLNQTLEKTLSPTVNYLSKNSIKNYRWDTWIGQSKNELYSDYLYQVVTMSYQKDEIGKELRTIFAVGNKNGILKDYFDDERYIIKYKIECNNEELDVMSSDVCEVIELKINNEEILPKISKHLIVNQANAKEYQFEIPAKFQARIVTISVTYKILKWALTDRRIYISKQIFETTSDAEFNITVSDNIRIRDIISDTTEISSLSTEKNLMTFSKKDDQGNDISACILCRSSLLAGSSIRFELQRFQN